MSGLLRRFRRGKPKEEDEAESPDAPEEVREGDTDIYPHRAPDRRSLGDDDSPRDAPASVVEEGGELVAPSPELPSEIGPPPLAPTPPALEPDPTPTPVAPLVPEVTPELPASAPPRLPEAADGGSRSAHRPLTAPGHCFLCGAELSGAFCPVCRMTWNE